jgi:UDP-N-acetylmuramate dehydrogenase
VSPESLSSGRVASAAESFTSGLIAIVGPGQVRRHASLAPYTTFRVGGPADWLVEPRGEAQIVSVLGLARASGVAVTMLGGGSNVLIGDRGIRGLVLRPRAGGVAEEGEGRARADAAATLNGLVRWSITRGLAGIEAWAGTPGTVGGAVFGNAHYAGRSIDEAIDSVRLAVADGEPLDVPRTDMEFGYDRSRLQRTHEVLLSARFRLWPGADPAALRAIARQSLAHRKQTQPLDTPSAGCIFQNPDPAREPVPPGIPASAGALIDRAGLRGRALGRAQVSPVHANFIVNQGGATAAEIRALIDLCRETVADRFGVRLREEIIRLGEFGD